MEISHRLEKDNNIYIYVDIIDEVEFSKEFLNKEDNKSFVLKLKEYVKNNFNNEKTVVLVINGVLIGTISLGIFFIPLIESKEVGEIDAKENEIANISPINSNISKEDNNILQDNKSDLPEQPVEVIEKNIEIKPVKNNNTNEVPKKPVVNNNTMIKLKTNGKTITIALEEYIIGVVAAEMPASFTAEALKAQAVAARTFAMKKISSGITLLDSTSHQVYKDKNEQRAMWGKSYDSYYHKIRNAVYDTKGEVLKYNGKYIDALYHSMSNGKTELPKYVWGSNLEYLQSVSSNWDKNVSGYEKIIEIPYATLNSKLKININSTSNISINSYTVSKRVDSITLGDKTFSGITLRSKLGLRSTDFDLIQTSKGIKFTTRGYGHGVGMSQYRCK